MFQTNVLTFFNKFRCLSLIFFTPTSSKTHKEKKNLEKWRNKTKNEDKFDPRDFHHILIQS